MERLFLTRSARTGNRPGPGRVGHSLWLALVALGTVSLAGPVSRGQTGSAPPPAEPRRVRVTDETGAVSIGREYGPPAVAQVLMPDGRLAALVRPVYTQEPFQPLSLDQLRKQLVAGEYRGFEVERTEHYLVFYQSSPAFAKDSARLLESLYKKLGDKFHERGFAVKPAEFPLVAVIFRSEEEFRAHRQIDSDVQAYYDIVSNRIFFYEISQQQREDPQFAAMRKPQTVVHEGTHQVLQNIGVQPRQADWPPWLVEGLAELAAASDRRNGEWVQFSQVNPLHIATLDDLRDSVALQGNTPSGSRAALGRDPNSSLVEYIITRTDLSPTDYSLAWALTHYLANSKTPAFLSFLKEMSQVSPGVKRTVEENTAVFVRHFGDKFRQIDAQVDRHLAKLRSQTNLVYYGVVFEQPMPGNRVRRATLVSRSPQVIREWVTTGVPDPQGGPPRWQAFEFRTRAEAIEATESWWNGN
jgi:hypothetical protein